MTVAETGWYTALAGSRGAPRDAERTTCRRMLTNRSLGVTHAVLPVRGEDLHRLRRHRGPDRGDRLAPEAPGPPVRADRGARPAPRHRRDSADPMAVRAALAVAPKSAERITPGAQLQGAASRPVVHPMALEWSCSTLYVALRVNVNQRSREGSLGSGLDLTRRRPARHPPGKAGSHRRKEASAGWSKLFGARSGSAGADPDRAKTPKGSARPTPSQSRGTSRYPGPMVEVFGDSARRRGVRVRAPRRRRRPDRRGRRAGMASRSPA